MPWSAKFILFALFFLNAYGQQTDKENRIERIVSGINQTSDAIHSVKILSQKESHGFNDALNVIQSFTELSGVYFSGLNLFATSIDLLNGLIGDGETPDQTIIAQLIEVKDSIGHIELVVSNLVPHIKNDLIKQRFVTHIQNKVNQLQRIFDEFAEMPDSVNREALRHQCMSTNGMKTVLTDLHSEIVKGGDGNYNELLDGGIRREMQDSEKWSHAFIALYMQTSLLRSACFPVMAQHEWHKSLEFHINVQQKDLAEIIEVAKHKLVTLRENALNNGRNAIPMWLEDNWTQWGWQLMQRTRWYLNDNFNDGGNSTQWNVVVVASDMVNYRNPELIYVSKSPGLSVIVSYGKLSRMYRCDENWPFNYKTLTCFKIAGHHISYYGNIQTYWDTHEFDDYE